MKTNIPIVSEYHCNRKRYGLITNNYFKVKEAELNGCIINNVTYTLIYPQLCLFDLSNFPIEFSSLTLEEGLKIYHHLKNHIHAYLAKTEIQLISGDDLKTEICICSSRYVDLLDFKKNTMRDLVEKKLYNPKKSTVLFRKHGLDSTLKLSESNNKVISFYENFKTYYKKFIQKSYYKSVKLLNLTNIYDFHPVWHEISLLGKNKLFALGAGMALGLGYYNVTNDPQIYFIEIHRNNDPDILKRLKPFDEIYPKPISGSSWVIIDKAYTGGTIQEAKYFLTKATSTTNITTVALFPKSLNAIKQSDYFVYAGHLIKTTDILPQLSELRWHIDIIEYITGITYASSC